MGWWSQPGEGQRTASKRNHSAYGEGKGERRKSQEVSPQAEEVGVSLQAEEVGQGTGQGKMAAGPREAPVEL